MARSKPPYTITVTRWSFVKDGKLVDYMNMTRYRMFNDGNLPAGVEKREEVLMRETVRTITAALDLPRPAQPDSEFYCYGWDIQDSNGKRI